MPAQKAHEPAGTREREQRAREPAQHAAVAEGAEEQGEQPRRRVQLPAVRVVEQPPHGPWKRGHGIVWSYVLAWVGAISVVLALILAGLGAVLESGSSGATTTGSSIQLGLGILLLGFACKRMLGDRRASARAGGSTGPPPT